LEPICFAFFPLAPTGERQAINGWHSCLSRQHFREGFCAHPEASSAFATKTPGHPAGRHAAHDNTGGLDASIPWNGQWNNTLRISMTIGMRQCCRRHVRPIDIY
jgi:hypothetical protein